MRLILLLVLAGISSIVFGQNSYKKGYIVNNNGDTSTGFIKENIDEKLSQSIDFKDADNKQRTLLPADIRGFGFTGGNQFRKVTYTDVSDGLVQKTHFAKLLFNSVYQLLSFYRKDNLYIVIVTRDTTFFLFDDVRTSLGDMVENGNFRNLLHFVTRECDRISSRASDVPFTEQGFISYFKAFEKCNGTLDRTVTYYSKPKREMNIYLVAGAFSLNKETEFVVQGLVNFGISSRNENTSLSTGLVYLKNVETTNETYTFGEIEKKHTANFFELPFLIRYDILKKRVRPYVYGGAGVLVKNLRDVTTTKDLSYETVAVTEKTSIDPTIILVAGIDIRILKRLFIDLNWRWDLGLHIPIAGIAIKIK